MAGKNKVSYMKRLDIFEDWHGWHRMEVLLGLSLTLIGLVAVLFPRLLVFIFAAICIGVGLTLMYAGFRERVAARAFRRDESRFDIHSAW